MFKEGFEGFIKDTLASFFSDANAITRLCLMLKNVKLAIKDWLPSRRIDHKARLLEIENLVQDLDIQAETSPLSQEEWSRK